MNDRNKNGNATIYDYLADHLNGKLPINQLRPQHPYLSETLGLKEILEGNHEHIFLCSTQDAYNIWEDLSGIIRNHRKEIEGVIDTATTYLGNAKDTNATIRNVGKLANVTGFRSAFDAISNLKFLGIKAISYKDRLGKEYIKITGYPGIRRILNGTRYRPSNTEVTQIGIGKMGTNSSILQGMKFSVYTSLGYRPLEFIFKDEVDTVRLFANITMDMAKTIVIASASKLAAGTLVKIAAVSLAGSLIIGVAIGIFLVIAVNELDKKFDLTGKLDNFLRDIAKNHKKISSDLGMQGQLLHVKKW
ncbi:membrane protein [Xenorhabdus beddingii]|uniref:Membrane protein n=1 Tax=Xenorhabdus beddingii TaxID=40578 RepID=A0A1Y2SLC2_9GAMM|nr:hypothetical protein [Xenorhabdus beddingii]OTA19323.1 membrane protein [Xenorhabdus beddingii]